MTVYPWLRLRGSLPQRKCTANIIMIMRTYTEITQNLSLVSRLMNHTQTFDRMSNKLDTIKENNNQKTIPLTFWNSLSHSFLCVCSAAWITLIQFATLTLDGPAATLVRWSRSRWRFSWDMMLCCQWLTTTIWCSRRDNDSWRTSTCCLRWELSKTQVSKGEGQWAKVKVNVGSRTKVKDNAETN